MFAYFASGIIPLFLIYILVCGIRSKKDVLKLFTEGVKNGLKTTLKIFPYVFAITIAVNLLRETKTIDLVISPLSSILQKLSIPKGIVPLIILRPMSGSASTTLVLDIIKNYGVDSLEGTLASVIMGSTETTFYVITILLTSTGIKKYRGTVWACLISDVVAIIISIILIKIGII